MTAKTSTVNLSEVALLEEKFNLAFANFEKRFDAMEEQSKKDRKEQAKINKDVETRLTVLENTPVKTPVRLTVKEDEKSNAGKLVEAVGAGVIAGVATYGAIRAAIWMFGDGTE